MIQTNTPRQQTGAALITGLLILMVMTMLALSAMRQTSLEEKIAANTQNQFEIFQAAETQLQNAINESDTLEDAFQETSTFGSVTNSYSANVVDSNITASATISWLNSAPPVDLNGGSGSELGTYIAQNLQVQGTAAVNGTGASNTQTVEMLIIGLNNGNI